MTPTPWMSTHLLSFLVFAPAILGLLLLAFPERQAPVVKWLALAGSVGFFVISLARLLALPADAAGTLLVERSPWFTVVGLPVDYHFAADGLNLWLVLLTTFLEIGRASCRERV